MALSPKTDPRPSAGRSAPPDPRLPSDARASGDLANIALIQRGSTATRCTTICGRLDFSVANNCLKEGLWEVKLARRRTARPFRSFTHVDFPKAEYAKLLDSVSGMRDADAEPLVASYPKLAGLPVPLDKLRRVVSESPLPPLDLHLSSRSHVFPSSREKRNLS